MYTVDNFDQSQNQSFAIGDFFESIGDTVQSGIENVGANFDANAVNAAATAAYNKAVADSVKMRAENQQKITRAIFTVLIVAILALTTVSLFKQFINKK